MLATKTTDKQYGQKFWDVNLLDEMLMLISLWVGNKNINFYILHPM